VVKSEEFKKMCDSISRLGFQILFFVILRYQPIWDVIDERWDKQLHRPLHATGYYLNPQFHYSP